MFYANHRDKWKELHCEGYTFSNIIANAEKVDNIATVESWYNTSEQTWSHKYFYYKGLNDTTLTYTNGEDNLELEVEPGHWYALNINEW